MSAYRRTEFSKQRQNVIYQINWLPCFFLSLLDIQHARSNTFDSFKDNYTQISVIFKFIWLIWQIMSKMFQWTSTSLLVHLIYKWPSFVAITLSQNIICMMVTNTHLVILSVRNIPSNTAILKLRMAIKKIQKKLILKIKVFYVESKYHQHKL